MEKRTKNIWQLYIGKQVRIIVDDYNSYPKPRDGIFISEDNTHIFLKLDNQDLPKPFLKTTIRRVELIK